jgi:molybdate transport system substrate-binding protein
MKLTRRMAVWCAIAWLGLFLAPARPAANPAARPTARLTISAAASLMDALNAIDQNFQRAHPDIEVTPNFGASGTLELQIEQGAPADVFISAAPQQMDALAAKNLLLTGTRVNLLQNELVLIAPKDSKTVTNFEDLKGPNVRVIAVGDPRSVPAGTYAQQVLTAMGMYDALKSKMTLATDVRQVLADVETGSAEAGLVYATDAAISSKVRVVMDAPAGTHQLIVYPAAVVRTSMSPDAARAYVNYLASPSAREVFAKYGFRPAAK